MNTDIWFGLTKIEIIDDDEIEEEDHVRLKRNIFSKPRNLQSSSNNPTNEPINLTSTTPKIYKKQKFLPRPTINSKFSRNFHTTTKTTTTNESVSIPTTAETLLITTTKRPIDNDADSADITNPKTPSSSSSSLMKRMLKTRVKFVESPNRPRPTSPGIEGLDVDNSVTMSEGRFRSDLSTTTSDILKSESIKSKDSKAVVHYLERILMPEFNFLTLTNLVVRRCTNTKTNF